MDRLQHCIGDSLAETLSSACSNGIPLEMLPAVKNVDLIGPGDTVIEQNDDEAPIILPSKFRNKTIGFNLETGNAIKITRIPTLVCTDSIRDMVNSSNFNFDRAIANFNHNVLLSTGDTYPVINNYNQEFTIKGEVENHPDTCLLKVDSATSKTVCNEIRILSKLQHSCIASCLASSSCGKSCVIGTYEIDSFTFFRDGADLTTCFEYLICILQLLDAVSFIHSNDIVHRDINPCCIEVSPSSCKLLLSGFSFATSTQDSNNLDGCLKNMNQSFSIPPEMLEENSSCGFHSDIYRVGVSIQNWLADKTDSLAVKSADISCLLLFAETLTVLSSVDRPSAQEAFSSASALLQELKLEEAEWHYIEGIDHIPCESFRRGTRAKISSAMHWLWNKSNTKKQKKAVK